MSDDQLRFVQIALNTCDPAGTLRLYCEMFGTVAGGGNAFWGDATRNQGLDNDARGTVWWLVGRQPFMQFEIFQHTNPPQQPIREDNRASDLGWTRFGVTTGDFDAALAALKHRGLATITPPVTVGGLRRVAFRDPFVGCFVEMFEDGPSVPGQDGWDGADTRPAVVYAACSVSDLNSARRFYTQVLGLEAVERSQLHLPEHEALWGLDGAQCDGFLLRLGDKFVEVVQYESPEPRPRPDDHRIVDQGIMNIAIGSRDVPFIAKLVADMQERGVGMSVPFGNDIAFAVYLTEPERELEILGLAEEADAVFGFVPGPPFFS